MPDPRPLGTTAKVIVDSLRDLEEADIADALALTAAVGKGDTDAVLALADRIARRNLGTFSALTFLGANILSKAQDALIDAKRRLTK